jgi:hypothetical protein
MNISTKSNGIRKLRPLPKPPNILSEPSLKNNVEIKGVKNDSTKKSISLSHTSTPMDYNFAINYLIANLKIIYIYFEQIKTITDIYDEFNVELLKQYVSNLNILDENIVLYYDKTYQYGGSKLTDFFKKQTANIKDQMKQIKEKAKVFVNKIMLKKRMVSPSINSQSQSLNNNKLSISTRSTRMTLKTRNTRNVEEYIFKIINMILRCIILLIKHENGIIYNLLKYKFDKLNLINKYLQLFINKMNEYITLISPNDIFKLHIMRISTIQRQSAGRQSKKNSTIKPSHLTVKKTKKPTAQKPIRPVTEKKVARKTAKAK